MKDPYEEIADALSAAAEALRGLAGQNLPGLTFVQLSIQPAQGWDNNTVISMVDTVGRALLGKPGETQQMSSGTYHHTVRGAQGPLHVAVYQTVDSPEKRALEVELARLRVEIKEVRDGRQ